MLRFACSWMALAGCDLVFELREPAFETDRGAQVHRARAGDLRALSPDCNFPRRDDEVARWFR
jgi:hypothetical protein